MVPAPIHTVGLDDYDNARKVWCAVDANGTLSPPPEHIQDAFFAGHEKSNAPISESETPLVVIIGAGSHCLRLIKALEKHYYTFVYDDNKENIEALNKDFALLSKIAPTTDATCFKDATHFIVSAPSDVSQIFKTTFIRKALSGIALYARPGSTVIIDGSVSAGTTRLLLEDLIVAKGMKAGFSPSLNNGIDLSPATFTSTPKFVSAFDDIAPSSLSSITALYAPVFSILIPTSPSDLPELTTLHGCDQAGTLSTSTHKKPTISPNFTNPFGGSGSICSSDMPTSRRESDAEWAAFPSAHRKSSCLFTLERPRACADRAMKILLSAGRRRSSWTLQSRKPRVLVVGLGSTHSQQMQYTQKQPQLSISSVNFDASSPGVAIISRLRSRWDATVEFADPDIETVEDVAAVVGLEICRFDEKSRWHTMGLSWFDLVIVASPVEELGLDAEPLTRLTRTVVVDFSGQKDG